MQGGSANCPRLNVFNYSPLISRSFGVHGGGCHCSGVVVTARRWLGGCRRTLTSGKARGRPLVASAGGAWVEGGTAPGLVGGLWGNKGSPKSRALPFSLCSFSSSGTGLPRFPTWERRRPRHSCQVYPRTEASGRGPGLQPSAYSARHRDLYLLVVSSGSLLSAIML